MYIDNTSQIQIPFRTMPPLKTSAHGTIPTPNPTHHTVLDDQPLEHINFTHAVYPKLVVCMYTNHRARLTRQENHQP